MFGALTMLASFSRRELPSETTPFLGEAVGRMLRVSDIDPGLSSLRPSLSAGRRQFSEYGVRVVGVAFDPNFLRVAPHYI
jgi:hypothetical protein